MTPINRGEKFKCVILPHRQCPEMTPGNIQSWPPRVFRRTGSRKTPTSP